MAPAVVAAALFASLTYASALQPREVEVLYAARSRSDLSPLSPRGIEARSDANKTFEIGWQVQNEPLFSANWTGGTGEIPIGGVVPVEASGTEAFSLSVECNDCRTFGNILADFNDDDGLNMSLTFNNVGVHMDFGVFASEKGTFTIGLGRFFGGKNAAGQNLKGIFNATLGIGIDLVLSFTGDVKATGGFQIAIPDKERIGLVLDLPDETDILAGNFNVSAGLDLVPNIKFAMLPIQLSRASANITAAIVLRAEAALGLQKTPITQKIDFAATASAVLTLAEVTFGTVVTDGKAGTCKQALFVDVDSNAGAQAVVGGEIAGHEFGGGPDVSTVFLSAGTTTCLDQRTDAGTKTVAPTTTTTTTTTTTSKPTALPACPTSALLTQTRNVTSTLSLTSCLVSAVNCPNSLTQVVVVTQVQATTVTSCAASLNVTATTTTKTTVAPVAFNTAGAITLPPLKSPFVTSVAASLLANVTAPVNATVAGVAVLVPVLTTPPPPPPPPAPEPEPTVLVNIGGKNASSTAARPGVTSNAGLATARGSAMGGLMGLLGVLAGAVVLL